MEEQATPPRKRAGWPKGKPRLPKQEEVAVAADRAEQRAAMPPKMIAKMKSRPNWESDDYVGVGMDGVDRLHIPDEIVQSLYGDGIALQWVTKSIRGQETPQELSKMTRGGWTPVHQSDFDGLLDGMFMPKGHDDVITVDDCMLVARPAEIHTKAKMLEKRSARRPLEISEEQLGRGIPNVSGADHKSVHNSIKKTMERIEIPE
jgi:hypothetical protein